MVFTHEMLLRGTRLGGEDGGGEEKSPPSNREKLVSECRVLERQIQAVDATCKTQPLGGRVPTLHAGVVAGRRWGGGNR